MGRPGRFSQCSARRLRCRAGEFRPLGCRSNHQVRDVGRRRDGDRDQRAVRLDPPLNAPAQRACAMLGQGQGIGGGHLRQ